MESLQGVEVTLNLRKYVSKCLKELFSGEKLCSNRQPTQKNPKFASGSSRNMTLGQKENRYSRDQRWLGNLFIYIFPSANIGFFGL